MADNLEAWIAQGDAVLAEKFRQSRLARAQELREAASLAPAEREGLLLRMADEWEEAAGT